MNKNCVNRAVVKVDTLTSFRGPQGPKGEPGYTPVKGVDYWTAEEQAAIDAARSGERERTQAETARAQAEQSRATAEQSRENAEQSRTTAEQGREAAEQSRATAEQSRADAEAARVKEHDANQAASREQTERAGAAADKIDNMTVSAAGLAEGKAPTATISETGGHKHIAFGVPVGATGPQGPKGDKGEQGPQGDRGEPGDTGLTPQISVQVETGDPGTEASVIQSGTTENPVLTFTIPRGDTGTIEELPLSDALPAKIAEVASAGVSEEIARVDHVHQYPDRLVNANRNASLVPMHNDLGKKEERLGFHFNSTDSNGIIDNSQQITFDAYADGRVKTYNSYMGISYEYYTTINKPKPTDIGAVSFNDQSLTEDQKAKARANIGAGTGDIDLSDVDITAIGGVAYDRAQELTAEQKNIARDNIGAGTSRFSGSYEDLTDKPAIPSKVSELQNDSNYLTEAPVTSVNGATGAVNVVETVASGAGTVSSLRPTSLAKSVSSAKILLVQPVSDSAKKSPLIFIGPFTDSVDYSASQIYGDGSSWIGHVVVWFFGGGTQIYCRSIDTYVLGSSGSSGSSFAFSKIYAIF